MVLRTPFHGLKLQANFTIYCHCSLNDSFQQQVFIILKAASKDYLLYAIGDTLPCFFCLPNILQELMENTMNNITTNL